MDHFHNIYLISENKTEKKQYSKKRKKYFIINIFCFYILAFSKWSSEFLFQFFSPSDVINLKQVKVKKS